MKTLIQLITILCFLLPGTGFTQHTNYVGDWYQAKASGKTVTQVNSLQAEVSDFHTTQRYNVSANMSELKYIMRRKPELLNLTVPYGNKTYTLNLAKVDVTSEGFKVKTNKGRVKRNTGVQYRGIVDGNPSHIASLNLTSTDKSAIFSTDDGNFVVSSDDDRFIVYNQDILPFPEINYCETQEPQYSLMVEPLVVGGCKTVKVYLECDYALYQNKGSNLTAVTNYMVGLFNQTATIYANEGITVQTSEIYVWTTPDPYANMSASQTLEAFRLNRGTSFNGNLAHFVSTRTPLSGIAYLNTLCNKAFAYGVSRITSSYNNFPTYSWSVNVLTHELGHNIGSPHTHSCSWPGGAIDNCYTTEGGCPPGPPPVNGGTIMSYCHLGNAGVNFNNGFGPLPGDLIRSRVANASCVPSTGSGPAPTALVSNNITSTSVTLSWTSSSSNFTVQYKPSVTSVWTTVSTVNNSINITGLTPGTAYSWKVKSDCSLYSYTYAFTTQAGNNTLCATPGSPRESSITATTATLQWNSVSGATSYYVLYKRAGTSGWSLRSVTGTSVTLTLLRNTAYQWKVKTICTGGRSSAYSLIRQFNTLQ